MERLQAQLGLNKLLVMKILIQRKFRRLFQI